jgi:hypothetical protein
VYSFRAGQSPGISVIPTLPRSPDYAALEFGQELQDTELEPAGEVGDGGSAVAGVLVIGGPCGVFIL